MFDVQTRDLFAGAATFATTAGTASGISRSKSTLPCDISITGPAQSVGASDGFMWLGLDLDLAPVAAPTRYLSVLQGLTAIESTSDSVCLGQHVVRTFMNAWNWLAFPVLSHPLAVSEDGKTIEADFTEAQEGMRATHTLRFTAMRE